MRLVLLNVNTFHRSKHTTIDELNQRRRQRERQKKKTVGLDWQNTNFAPVHFFTVSARLRR